MYTTDYDLPTTSNTREEHLSLVFHANMYAIADKYDIAALKNLAKDKYSSELVSVAGDFIAFFTSIPCVYSTTNDSDRTLRNVVVQHARLRAKDFIKRNDEEPFEKVCCNVPSFA